MARNNLTVIEAAELMGVSPQFVRVAIQRGIFPWGVCMQMKGKRYTYFISRQKFTEHTGIEVPDNYGNDENDEEDSYEDLKEAY